MLDACGMQFASPHVRAGVAYALFYVPLRQRFHTLTPNCHAVLCRKENE